MQPAASGRVKERQSSQTVLTPVPFQARGLAIFSFEGTKPQRPTPEQNGRTRPHGKSDVFNNLVPEEPPLSLFFCASIEWNGFCNRSTPWRKATIVEIATPYGQHRETLGAGFRNNFDKSLWCRRLASTGKSRRNACTTMPIDQVISDGVLGHQCGIARGEFPWSNAL